jgi:3-oxoacyl-[acyl-carrier protein] reductase
MELTDRVALVTGGSGDLGTAIARSLASAGSHVAVTWVDNHEGAERTCAAVEALGRRAFMVRLDQADPSAIPPVVQEVAHTLGRLDLLVNNAAWNIGVPFTDLDALTTEVWDRVYATNVRGPFQLARAAAPYMRRQGGGRIVNIASVAGLLPTGSSIAYATAKAALIHLTRCLAVALAPDVTVNCIAPGLMADTRMAQRLPPAVREMAEQRAVLRRTTRVEDVAEQVTTFCRLDSVTGQVLTIDAGIHFH